MAAAREAEAGERLRAARLKTEADLAELELSQLQEAAADLQGLEQRYWHDFNDFQRQLQAHVEDRDALLSQVRNAACGQEHLNAGNILTQT